MPQTINTNVMSLNAQRNLNRTQSDLATTIQRLSSGLRINSAKDDAAGIAISTRMSAQISGLSVTIRNANDGISIAQTAEGAIDEMVKSPIRANDLALQAARNNTSADRASHNQ
jgi:flagellin